MNLDTELYIDEYLKETKYILSKIDYEEISKAIDVLVRVREDGGRLFILGVGGSSATASHAVNDFRKICEIETYSATENVAELTAHTNDSGWENSLSNWLIESKVNYNDVVLFLSVGGGDVRKNISINLIEAMDEATIRDASTIAIVGRDGGYLRQRAYATILIPPIYPKRITPHTEEIHGVILHLLASSPQLKKSETTWESIGNK